MKADKVRQDHRVILGPDKLAEVLEVEHDGAMVALRLRQQGADGRTKGVWVAMRRTCDVPIVRGRRKASSNGSTAGA